MTLAEFIEMADAVLSIAPDISNDAKASIIHRMLKSNRIYMPSEQALVDESARQNREMTEAVKMAAASGVRNIGIMREPS